MSFKLPQHTEHGYSSLQLISLRITPEEGCRLKVNSLYHVHILNQKVHHLPVFRVLLVNAEIHHLPDIVIVDTSNNCRNEGYCKAGLLAVPDCLHLLFKKRLPPEFHIYIVPCPVKLHKDNRGAGLLQHPGIVFLLCQPSAIGINLYVRETLLSCKANDFRQIISYRRLTAAELYIKLTALFTLLQKPVIPGAYFIERRLRWIHILPRQREAIWAVLIASPGHINQNAAGCLKMIIACSAVERTFIIPGSSSGYRSHGRNINNRILYPLSEILCPLCRQGLKPSMLRTFLHKKNTVCRTARAVAAAVVL